MTEINISEKTNEGKSLSWTESRRRDSIKGLLAFGRLYINGKVVAETSKV